MRRLRLWLCRLLCPRGWAVSRAAAPESLPSTLEWYKPLALHDVDIDTHDWSQHPRGSADDPADAG